MAASINKTGLIEDIAARLNGVSKQQVQEIVDAFLSSVTDNVAAGMDVNLPGFGRFTRQERAARKGRNPQTGATIDIAASKAPAFKAGKTFKDRVNS